MVEGLGRVQIERNNKRRGVREMKGSGYFLA